MPGRTIRIGTFAGIPLGIHPLWPAIVALIAWMLATGWYPAQVEGIAPTTAWILGVISALLLFASVLAHEYGHALVARRHEVEVEGIDLWLLGGVAKISGTARRPADELAYAIAGPAVTVVIAAVRGALLLVLPAGTALHALVTYQALINVVPLVFNMLPRFRSTAAECCTRCSGGAATTASRRRCRPPASAACSATASSCSGSCRRCRATRAGCGSPSSAGSSSRPGGPRRCTPRSRRRSPACARELMSAPASCLPLTARVAEAVDLIVREPHPAFPVLDGTRVVGLVRVSALERIPAAERGAVLISTVVDREPELLISPDADVAALLDEPAFTRVQRAVVVDDEDRPVGIVSITDVQRTFEMRHRLTPAGARG